MNKYKLIAVDIDGTLLNSNKELTIKTIETIKKLNEVNVKFTLATGRPIVGIKQILDKLDLDVLVITYNGAKILKSKSREVIYNKSLNNSDAKKIIELGLINKTNLIVWSEEELYVNELNDSAIKYSQISNVNVHIINDYKSLYEKPITKIIWYDDASKVQDFIKYLNNETFNNVNYHTSNPEFLEFVDGEVSKANALQVLERYYNIAKEEIIAIGDGYNDLSMIEYAGLGVAMDNAPQGVKDKSDFITKSNDDDGVSFVIDKFIFNK